MQEFWKDIKGYEGKYQVSNLGNVRSLDTKCIARNQFNGTGIRTSKGKVLSQSGTRYKKVALYDKNHNKKFYSVHRLVAEAFILNPNNYKYVNHKDENKFNNYYINLEWCTQKHNCNCGTRNMRLSKNNSYKVNQYDSNHNFIKSWNSLREISMNLNVTISQLHSAIYSKKEKLLCGYIWKYADK